MPVVEFTHSEKGFYEDKQKQARSLVAAAQDAVNKAAQEGKTLVGGVLAMICESHEQEPPANAELVKNKQGKVIGLIWGDDYGKFLKGELTIKDAVVPPQPASPSRVTDRLARIEKRRAEKKARKAAKNGATTPHNGDEAPKKTKLKVLEKTVAVPDEAADAEVPTQDQEQPSK